MTRANDNYQSDPTRYPIPPTLTDTEVLGPYPALLTELEQLAASKVTVLLVGGTPELQRASARLLHERSARAGQLFSQFDCSGLTPEHAELRLFGGPEHLPSTGGTINNADAGTLYVAAVNELPLLLQPRFLRWLDGQRSVRVVASTPTDLTSMVERGNFRLDLAERLGLIELVLPAGQEPL